MDVSPNKIIQASKILSGLLFDPEFEVDKLELERKVILNEIAEAADNPHDKVAETFIKCLYKKHPIRNPTLGTKKTVKRLGIEELKETHRKQYVPENMVVLLTGKFTQQDVDTILANFENKVNQSHIQKKQHIFNEGPPTKRSTVKRSGLGQAYLCFGLRTPPAKNPDAVALDLLNGVLGLGESSRLFVELREKRALTYDFNSMNISGLDHGFFTVACAVQTKSLQLTEQIIWEELEKLALTPVGEEELEKSKNVIVGDILRAMDNPHELPRLMTDTDVVYADENGLADYVEKLVALSSKEIQTTAQRYFQEENYATATLIPK
jgi:predicted Zn-dependent peptidase